MRIENIYKDGLKLNI